MRVLRTLCLLAVMFAVFAPRASAEGNSHILDGTLTTVWCNHYNPESGPVTLCSMNVEVDWPFATTVRMQLEGQCIAQADALAASTPVSVRVFFYARFDDFNASLGIYEEMLRCMYVFEP